MAVELSKIFQPSEIQNKIKELWLKSGAFNATPDARAPDKRFIIMMPLPNVTGALHMGHAMDNVMQDLLVRWHRMQGDNTLWQPGTDHAGIATQAVVEKRLFELEGKTRNDVGREALVARIWAWKDEYQQRIVRQQQEMGCSCDWRRQRFTMDEVCQAAVREAFFKLFADHLIYRGDRLVNWDCQLQTAVSDDEVYHEPVAGHFWHLKYPVVNPAPGEPEFVIVATTRPETFLGDTAVACHPDPETALNEKILEQQQKIAAATPKEKPAAEEELQRLNERLEKKLPALKQLCAMAKAGRRVKLPVLNREIPLVLDTWAKPELGSGCVKITPAHDPNDYAVWQRHPLEIGIINILNPNGTLNANAGPYANLDRFAARKSIVADFQAAGLLEAIEDREIEIGHSDRSKTPVEPYLSKQWFVRMGDVPGGITLGKNTRFESKTTGLAQAAIEAATLEGKFSGGKLNFHPERYLGGYLNWLAEKRDWCISRQLWWGHQIPVWTKLCSNAQIAVLALKELPAESNAMQVWVSDSQGNQHEPNKFAAQTANKKFEQGPFEIQVCLRDAKADKAWANIIEALGFERDPDVLDTWFSSALWPFSTLGWPDPQNASLAEGQAALGANGNTPSAFEYYYPGSCLVTARDIITLWVAKMVIMGLYNHGQMPFKDCFVHAKILDGKGVTMSKSKGNGVDPVNIIERYGADAMRYLICDMETGMQDVRLPVQATCPTCAATVELTEAKHGRTVFTYLCTACQAEFDVLGSMAGVPAATIFSDRFEAGKNFCNKLWNAARFALMNLGDLEFRPLTGAELAPEDRWILSRLNQAISQTTTQLSAYQPSAALSTIRDFFWGELCDWYLEIIKSRLRAQDQAQVARQILAVTLDQVLRLLHPFVPFITEELWSYLNAQAKKRGVFSELPIATLCLEASWPKKLPEWHDPATEAAFSLTMAAIGRLRELRARYDVPPKKLLPAVIRAQDSVLRTLRLHATIIQEQARLGELTIDPQANPPAHAATQVAADMEIFLGDVLDPEKEKVRLTSLREKLRSQLEVSLRKLNNPSFVERAPADVVEGEKAKTADLERQIAALDKNILSLT